MQLRFPASSPSAALRAGRASRTRNAHARTRAACAGAGRESREPTGGAAQAHARVARAPTGRESTAPLGGCASLRASCAALAAACVLAASPPAAQAEVCTAAGVCREQREELGDLALILRQRSEANKAENDAKRLDSYYKREWRINKILRADALPEPCDPRQPEFAYRCQPNAGLRRADELR
jgi:hypothetical protein